MADFLRSNFYPKNKYLDIEILFKIIKPYIIKKITQTNIEISDLSSLNNIRNNSIIFTKNKFIYKKSFKNLIIITNNKDIFESIDSPYKFLIKKYDEVYNLVLNHMYIHEDNIKYSDKFSFVNDSYISIYSKIDNSTIIGKNCIIGRGVIIGKDCIIKNNVIIKNSLLSNNIVIGDNCVIGGTGFGFDLKKMGSKNIIPQLGIVVIDDDVHIGSSCTIDRGKIDHTKIGKNSMIDNLVHIAHNVILGKSACIAAQCGIAGSTSIGDNIIMGGQSGISGHINIGNNVVIAGKSAVTKNILDNSVVAGFPASDIKEWKKNIIKLKKL